MVKGTTRSSLTKRASAALRSSPKPVQRIVDRIRGLDRPQSVEPATKPAAKLRLSGTPCAVCGSSSVHLKTVTSKAWPEKVFTMRVCVDCGFVGNPDNVHDYRDFAHVTKLPFRSRVGTVERKGREYFMAEMALEILSPSDADVLIYGAGRSYDNLHIAALPSVRSVAISDVMHLRDDADFVDSNAPVTQRFNVVIASEVVEHFLEPREDFGKLLDYVEGDGLLVCSTNLYDGRTIGYQNYIFIEGHTSYFTLASLELLARANGFIVDIRIPWVATGYGGPRKRYLLFTRSSSVTDQIVKYFETHEYAPSEPAERDANDPVRIKEEKLARQAEAAAGNG